MAVVAQRAIRRVVLEVEHPLEEFVAVDFLVNFAQMSEEQVFEAFHEFDLQTVLNAAELTFCL